MNSAPHSLYVVFVELPEIGRKLKAGESCAVVESVKTASDIYSPLSGEVTESNKAVVDDPALVNSECGRSTKPAWSGSLRDTD